MAFTSMGMATGESRDKDIEAFTFHGTSAVTSQNTRVQTGNFGLLLPLATANARAVVYGRRGNTGLGISAANPGVLAWSCFIGSSASFTSEAGLISHKDVGSRRYARMGTDGRIRFYDKTGAQIGMATSVAVPTAGVQEVVIFFDNTGNANDMKIYVYLGDSFDTGFSTGLNPDQFCTTSDALVWGEALPAATDRDADLYGDNMIVRASTTLADSPETTAYPRLLGIGGMMIPPTSEGTYTDWSGITASPNTFQDVDDSELPDHDADTSYQQATNQFPDPEEKHLFHFSHDLEADFPASPTIAHVQQRFAMRAVDTGKLTANMLHRLGGTDVETTVVQGFGTSYTGSGVPQVARPGGGAWTAADFGLTGGVSDLEFGMQSIVADGFDTGPRITLLPGPEAIYYTDTLPLVPAGAARRRFSIVI